MKVVVQHVAGVDPCQLVVDEHDRLLLQLGKRLEVVIGEAHRRKDDPVDILRKEGGEGLDLRLVPIRCETYQCAVMVLAEEGIDGDAHLPEEIVRHVGHGETDRLGLPAAEALRCPVRRIGVFLDDFHHPLARCGVDVRVIVDGPRDRLDRYAGLFCQVLQCNDSTSIPRPPRRPAAQRQRPWPEDRLPTSSGARQTPMHACPPFPP